MACGVEPRNLLRSLVDADDSPLGTVDNQAVGNRLEDGLHFRRLPPGFQVSVLHLFLQQAQLRYILIDRHGADDLPLYGANRNRGVEDCPSAAIEPLDVDGLVQNSFPPLNRPRRSPLLSLDRLAGFPPSFVLPIGGNIVGKRRSLSPDSAGSPH